MATKSYKIRLDLRVNEPLVDTARFKTRAEEIDASQRWLDDTREAFNVGVDYLTLWLLRMHRGAGVCRESNDGIWREWKEITTFQELQEARKRHKATPDSFALLENRDLLQAFKGKGKSEAEAVELAECCRRIANELCPPSEGRDDKQMPRDSLDLLLNPKSRALGVRDGPTHLKWRLWRIAAKSADADQWQNNLKASPELLDAPNASKRNKDAGPRLKKPVAATVKKVLATNGDWPTQRTQFFNDLDRPEWFRNQALAKCARSAEDHDKLLALLREAPEFQGEDGNKHISRLVKEAEKKKNDPWEKRQSEIVHSATREVCDYEQLCRNGCLPLPGFGCHHDDSSVTLGPISLMNVGSEWKRSMWDMAGQRVRSHLGWVRRRTNERLVWELLTALFNCGGWTRTKRDKTNDKKNLIPDDIRFDAPSETESADFEQRPAYGSRRWVAELREYESVEMPKHLEGIALGAAEQPRIRKRTAKGWSKIHEKWIDLIKKAQRPPSAADLVEAVNKMRTRKSRDFGDQRLFEWLAAPERRWLWDGSVNGDDNDCGRDDRDCVSAFTAHNEHIADKPDSITFTRSASVKHPVWPFFGENSAVEYWLERQNGTSRLVLVLKQLLTREDDGSYTAVDWVKIALRGYDDFEKSFALPDGANRVSAKQPLVFRDDLLGGATRDGTLSGMKLTWERDELEAHHRKRHRTKVCPRVFANFSCDAGTANPPEWLKQHVGSDVKLKTPRDGMTRVFFLKKAFGKESADDDSSARLAPGQRKWPKEAVENTFTVRGTDLGHRTSSAGAWWRLSLTKAEGQVAWEVGQCGDKPVYAILQHTATVSLPGDGESLPPPEYALRDRLYSLRTRLNLNNALLRITRLLTLESVTTRTRAGDKMRKRRDGTTKRVGVRWQTETKPLADDAIKANVIKAAESLLYWTSTDAMTGSLQTIGHDGSLWQWLAALEPSLATLAGSVPTTQVPTEAEAKRKKIDRDTLNALRQKEDDAFAAAVNDRRRQLAKALCDGYDAEKRIRAKSGLWTAFDAALVRELSYSDRKDVNRERELFANGLFRLLRKPPATKHGDRKDEANNLPHGETYRGGLSMARLNFLDDVKNFVRRWSCRSRWPGDLRRVPEDAKFDRCDTEHMDHLREHRAKLIAHADVAQTLGFEQDLRRGLWRFHDQSSGDLLWHRPERGHFYRENGDGVAQCASPEGVSNDDAKHPHPAFAPAHVLVYENLTRYRMSSDRPKNENAGLARWSHRRILAFAQHIGGLFGLPVATVDARFSSRYCSRCGSPGCRAVRFDPVWLNQAWLQRIRKDTKDQGTVSKNMRRVASGIEQRLKDNVNSLDREEDRPWVLRDGGTHFVCANPACCLHTAPINADENAAANIGLRFLRGIDGIRVTINANGKVTKSVGYVPPETILVRSKQAVSQREPFWTVPADTDAVVSRRPTATTSDGGAVGGATEEEDDDGTGGANCLFRDPFGGFRCVDRWFEGKVFWGAVARSCAAGIKAENASRFGSENQDSEDQD